MKFKQVFDTANKTPGVNADKFIILHHTATVEGTIKGVLRQLTTGPVSCHYVVDTNGDCYKIGRNSDILWHAGESSWSTLKNMNNYAVGIEIVGPQSNGGFSNPQRATVAQLVQELMRDLRIPRENVLRHKDVSPGRKTDVSDRFWSDAGFKTWEEYKAKTF
jgi:N-acetylmuramoyl-L-alanine amidase